MIDWTIHFGDIFTLVSGFAFVTVIFIKLRDALRDNTRCIERIMEITEKHTEQIDDHERQINIWKGAGVGR